MYAKCPLSVAQTLAQLPSFRLRNVVLRHSERDMADYRCYCMDGSGKIALAHWVEASDDAEAISKTEALKGDTPRCEIWLKNRLVARLSPEGRFERIDL